MTRIVVFIFALIVALAGALILLVAKADAQQSMPRCSPLAEMRTILFERFGERPVGLGILGGEAPRVLELFVSKGGSWSVTVTGTDEVSCMLASGTNWLAGPKEQDARH